MILPLRTVQNPVEIATDLGIFQDGDSLRFDASQSSLDDSGEEPSITLRLGDTYTGPRWWYAARLEGMVGRTPEIFVNLSSHFQSRSSDFQHAVWSYALDTEDWHEFDNETYVDGDVTVSNNSPFTQNTVYVAHNAAYPNSRTVRKWNAWMQDARVQDTPSSTDGVYGMTTARTDPRDGRSIPSLGLRAALISTGGSSKNIFIGMVGNHMETPAYWAFEGMVEFVLGGSSTANNLLDYWDFYLYHANTPGQWAGYFRSTPEDPTKGPAGWWDEDPLPLELHQMQDAAWQQDASGGCDVFIDYHSYANIFEPGNGDNAFYYRGGATATNFLDALDGYEADLRTTSSSSTVTPYYYFQNEYGVRGWSGSSESGGLSGRGPSDWQTFGANQMRALWDRTAAGDYTYGP